MSFYISEVRGSKAMKEVEQLLLAEGIQRDQNLDYTCAMYDENDQAIATGSCFGNTLRCFAVSQSHQGEGLLNEIITHLIEVQYDRGNYHLFLYTKPETVRFFRDLGFYEIARVDQKVVFMENRRTGFQSFLKSICPGAGKKSAAIVMNANPFTLGHKYLVEKAAAENDLVHIFVVEEDVSLIPFAVRKRLVEEGTRHLPNVICHASGPYIISNATFPSYFLKEEVNVITSHCRLDIAVFKQIAERLNISVRYVGEEPRSQVTGIYNQVMMQELPLAGISCVVVPRKEAEGQVISASTVRQCIQNGNLDMLRNLVPDCTWKYFTSPEASDLIKRIQKAGNVVHY